MTYYYRKDLIKVFSTLKHYLNTQYLVICDKRALWMWCRASIKPSRHRFAFFFFF